MAVKATYTQEEVRFFLEQVHNEMQSAVGERMKWPLNLIDVIMPDGSQREAAKRELELLIDRMLYSGVAEILVNRGREFLGVEILRKQNEVAQSDKSNGDEPIGFYA